jgi:hypothetical protein
MEQERQYFGARHECCLIQDRVIQAHSYVLSILPDKEKAQLTPQPSKVRMFLAKSGHVLNWLDGGRRVQCCRCKDIIAHSSYRKWLGQGACSGQLQEGQVLHPVPHGPQLKAPRVGTVSISRTHALVWTKGIWICTTCGAYAQTSGKTGAKHLGFDCPRSLNNGRRYRLNRFLKGFFSHTPAGNGEHHPPMYFKKGSG